jgi:hypothetical protein
MSVRWWWMSTGHAFTTAQTIDGTPAGSDRTRLLRTWLHRWLPWAPQLLPPAPATTTGTVTMLDLSLL